MKFTKVHFVNIESLQLDVNNYYEKIIMREDCYTKYKEF